MSLQNNTLSRAKLNDEAGAAQNIHYGDVLIKYDEVLDVSNEPLSYIEKQTIADKFKTSYLQNGDVIIADTAEDETVGKCTEIAGLTDQKVISGLHTMPVRPNRKFAPGFLGFYLNSAAYHDQLKPLMQGIKVTSISKGAVQDTVITFPSDLKEQKEIGAYFESLDRLITLHQNKCAEPPRSRNFSLAISWEQRKLGDCFEERNENMPNGELISVTINEGIKKFSELGRHDNSNEDKSKYKKVCVGDIAYNSMRMWQGASGCSPYEGIVSPAYTVLKPKDGTDSKCVSYLFKRQDMVHTFQLNSQGITSDNWNLKFPALSQIEIKLPPEIDEQKKIAAYFTDLDRLITLHQF